MEAAEEVVENHTMRGHVEKIEEEAITEEIIVMKETIIGVIEEGKITMTEEVAEIENIAERVDATSIDLTLKALKNLHLLSKIEGTETSVAHTMDPQPNPTKRKTARISQRRMTSLTRNRKNHKRAPQ